MSLRLLWPVTPLKPRLLGVILDTLEEVLYLGKCGSIARKRKTNVSIGPQMWSSILTLTKTLTLNFQGQIFYLLYLADYHKTKNKYIDWMLGLKFGHSFWPWPWPWSRIFKVYLRKIWSNCYKMKNVYIYRMLGLKCSLQHLGHNIDLL